MPEQDQFHSVGTPGRPGRVIPRWAAELLARLTQRAPAIVTPGVLGDLLAEVGSDVSVDAALKSSGSARIWARDVPHRDLGNVTGLARVEFARRRPALPAERLVPIPLAVHGQYAFKLEALPVLAEVEACAEKLARYRRTPLARDLYDLAWFAARPIDECPLRRLWVLKVFCDVVEDRRGAKPLLGSDVLTRRDVKDFPAAAIGVLTQALDIAGWEARVRSRFGFLAAMDEQEQRWAECNARDHDEVLKHLAAGGFVGP